MAKQIYKYPLEITTRQPVVIPVEKVLTVQEQRGTPCLWALVDINNYFNVGIEIFCFGTGDSLLNKYFDASLKYISTTQHADGEVHHWFYKEV